MKDYNLEEAARQYRDEFLDKNNNDISKYDIEDIFIAGAEWQYEQFEKNRLTACDNMTEEEAEREQEFTIDFIEKNNRIPTYSDAIEYGRRLMIDKACEWINLHIGELSDIYTRSAIRNEFLEDFRKAMQNG